MTVEEDKFMEEDSKFLPCLGLSEIQKDAESSKIIEIEEGNTFEISAELVTKNINGNDYLGYNGELPGPTLKVKQGSTMHINFINNIVYDTTIH
tara:strand:- start:1076 stop:1357 length:282 start_codon:yes stop_codon:yes gene_type:complete